MSTTSGFFNSVNGDRTYNADDLTNFFDGVLNDGVFNNYDASLVVSPGDGMSVNVAGGKALVFGKYILNTGVLNLPLEGSGTLPRYDAVVCGVDMEERTGTIYIKTGTAASSPTYPSLLNTANTKEICLAYIYVGAGVTSITAANITDTRSDPAVCGYVNLTNISASLNVLRNNVEITTAGTNTVDIGIPTFDAANDTLFVYLNGTLLQEVEEYMINGTGSAAKVDLANAIQGTSDNWLTFVVFKLTV